MNWSPSLSRCGDARARGVLPGWRALRRASAVAGRAVLLLTASLCGTGHTQAATPLATVSINTARDIIMVPVTVNGSNGLFFKLDTGFSMTMIHPDLPERLNLRREGEVTIAGIAGDEPAPTYEGAVLDIGGAKYEPRRVAALASDANRRRRRDGILGSGLFRQFVVEIDFASKRLALYAPTNFAYAGKGEVIPLRFRRFGTTPSVEASIHTTNATTIRGQFEIDTGCDSGVCLGHGFIVTNHLLDDTETRGGGKFGVGGGVKTRSGHLPELQLGAIKVSRPQTDFFIEGTPVDEPYAGHIGFGVLQRFKVIFDYSRRQMILEQP